MKLIINQRKNLLLIKIILKIRKILLFHCTIKTNCQKKKITQINMDKETEKLEQKDEEEGQLTIDVYQTASEIVIKSPVAGVRKEDLDVNITNDMVTIKGRRENDDSVVREDYFF